MLRTASALAAGVLVLTMSACTGDSTPNEPATPTSAAASATAAPTKAATRTVDYTKNTKRVCAKVDALLEGQELDRFATRLGQLIRFKQAKQTAKAVAAREGAKRELRNLATAVRQTSATAKDPDLKAAAEESAVSIEASATDNAFFAQLKTIKDVNRNLEAEMTPWLTPLATYCT